MPQSSSSSPWEAAAQEYADQLGETGVSYLQGVRGLDPDAIDGYLLGQVVEPLPGHEQYRGMLTFPYITRAGIVGIKFRCGQDHKCDDHGHKKYRNPSGSKTGLYNTTDLFRGEDTLALCEGEIDTITVSAMVGIPAVGLPGVQSWKRHHRRILEGFPRIVVFADNDVKENGSNPGRDLAKRVCEELPQARLVELPPGEDVNSFFLKNGPEALRDLADRA